MFGVAAAYKEKSNGDRQQQLLIPFSLMMMMVSILCNSENNAMTVVFYDYDRVVLSSFFREIIPISMY